MTALTSRPVGPATQSATPAQPLATALFPEAGNTFAVLDAASNPDLLDWLYKCEPEFESLYEGDLEPDVAEVAPYLVRVEPEGELADWLLTRGWGNHWGIFVHSPADFAGVRQHLRKFVKVHSEAGKPMFFRFYDPRVLRVYLPTCNGGEVAEFFGDLSAIVVEGEDRTAALKFENAGGKLKTSTIKIKEG